MVAAAAARSSSAYGARRGQNLAHDIPGRDRVGQVQREGHLALRPLVLGVLPRSALAHGCMRDGRGSAYARVAQRCRRARAQVGLRLGRRHARSG
jgi:hypothetical protein